MELKKFILTMKIGNDVVTAVAVVDPEQADCIDQLKQQFVDRVVDVEVVPMTEECSTFDLGDQSVVHFVEDSFTINGYQFGNRGVSEFLENVPDEYQGIIAAKNDIIGQQIDVELTNFVLTNSSSVDILIGDPDHQLCFDSDFMLSEDDDEQYEHVRECWVQMVYGNFFHGEVIVYLFGKKPTKETIALLVENKIRLKFLTEQQQTDLFSNYQQFIDQLIVGNDISGVKIKAIQNRYSE